MHQLSKSTVQLVTSSQVITSVVSVVKELLENSLDAAAENIEIKLEDGGLTKIELQDNGSGVQQNNVEYLCKPHYTSKIRNESDLYSLITYGFRGEALSSVCAVANVSVITKTNEDSVSKLYTFDGFGEICESKITHHNNGTIVIVKELFKNMPVRKQFYQNKRRIKHELKTIEELLISYSVIHPHLRIILRNNKELLFEKHRPSSIDNIIATLFGSHLYKNLTPVNVTTDEFEINGFIPSLNSSPDIVGRSVSDRIFLSVNNRPIKMKEISSLLKHVYSEYCFDGGTKKYPTAILSITVSPHLVDVNVEPNKTAVFLQIKDELMTALSDELKNIYKPINVDRQNTPNNNSDNSETLESDSNPEILSTENVNKNSEVFSISTQSHPKSCKEKSEVISAEENNSTNDSRKYSKINIENISIPLETSSFQLDHPQVTNEANKQPIVTDACENIKSPNQSILSSLNQSILKSPNQSVLTSPNQSILKSPNQSVLTSPNQSILKSPNQSVLTSPNQSLINITGFNHFETPEQMTEDINIHNKESVISNKTPELNIEQGPYSTPDEVVQIVTSDFIKTPICNAISRRNILTSDYLPTTEQCVDADDVLGVVANDNEFVFPSPAAAIPSTPDIGAWSKGQIPGITTVPTDVLQKSNLNGKLFLYEPVKSKENNLKRKSCSREEPSKNPITNYIHSPIIPTSKVSKRKMLKSHVCWEDVKINICRKTTKNKRRRGVIVVGNIRDSPLWIICLENKLYVTDKARMSEHILCESLLLRHHFKPVLLSKPVSLEINVIGEERYSFLLSQPTESMKGCGGRFVENQRFTENGFLIKRRSNNGNSKECNFVLSHTCDIINDDGLNDVIDIIDGMMKDTSHYERPKKIQLWCKNEAIRLSNLNSNDCSKVEFSDLLHDVLQKYDDVTDFVEQGTTSRDNTPILYQLVKVGETMQYDHT